MTKHQTVMYTSDEAAKKVTVTGWVSRDGRFFGDDEHLARWAGCTHMVCECGNEHAKGRTMCDPCSAKKQAEIYQAMPFKEWNGEPLVFFRDDRYFFSEEDLRDWCEDHEVTDLLELQLVICEPNKPQVLSGGDMYIDDLPEDMALEDVAPHLAAAIEQVNTVIREKSETLSWSAGKFRTEYRPKEAA